MKISVNVDNLIRLQAGTTLTANERANVGERNAKEATELGQVGLGRRLGAVAAVDGATRALISGCEINSSGGSKDGEGEKGHNSETHVGCWLQVECKQIQLEDSERTLPLLILKRLSPIR